MFIGSIMSESISLGVCGFRTLTLPEMPCDCVYEILRHATTTENFFNVLDVFGVQPDYSKYLAKLKLRLYLPFGQEEIQSLFLRRSSGTYMGPYEGCFGVPVASLLNFEKQGIPGVWSHRLRGEEVILRPHCEMRGLTMTGWNRIWFTMSMF